MDNNKKQIRLYNIIFPIWLLIVFPQTWIIAIPFNFIIDFLVIYFVSKRMGVESYKQFAGKSSLLAWIFGFISDFVGTGILFLILMAQNLVDWDWLSSAVNGTVVNPFQNIISFMIVLFAVAISGLSIYLLNYYITFRKSSRDIRVRISLALAIFTAPYLFFLPMGQFHGM